MINYDERYSSGYMEGFSDLYEACRFVAVQQMLNTHSLLTTPAPDLIMDIACGQGRYFPLLKTVYPQARIVGVDISHVGIQKARSRFVEESYAVAAAEALPWADDTIDFIFSIETLEHVADVEAAVQEWARVLKPGGRFFFTTPCANRFSLEWFLMSATGGLEPSPDGYGRFRRDEPGHIRRLKTQHVLTLFHAAGLQIVQSRFRTHFFTTIAIDWIWRHSRRLAYHVALLDWRLLRRLPNGASMLVVGQKPIQRAQDTL